MPHSPYNTIVYPPIDDLEEYRRSLRDSRSGFEKGRDYEFAEETLLDNGEALLEQCDFLDKKLSIKKREYSHLLKQNEALKKESETSKKESEASKKENEALKKENKALKQEIEALKSRELEEAAAMAVVEQLIPNDTDNGAKLGASPAPGNKAAETELEESGRSRETQGAASPLKRGASIDPMKDGPATKRERKNGKK